jgi:inositol-phosphate transport system substrate-binding protein
MVSKSGEEKAELSARLIAIATEPRINSLHALKSSHLAVTKSQSSQEFYLNNQWLADTSYLLNYAFSLPNNADFGQYDVIVWNGLTATWSGRSTPQEAANSVVREMKATMSDKVLIR